MRATGTKPTAVFDLSVLDFVSLLHLYRCSTQYDDWSAVWCSLVRWQWIVKRSLGDIGAVQFHFLCSVWPTSRPVRKQILLLFSDPSHPQILRRVAMKRDIPNNGYFLWSRRGPEKFSAPCHSIPNTQIWNTSQEGSFLYLQLIFAE